MNAYFDEQDLAFDGDATRAAKRQREYSDSELRGLRVAHDTTELGDPDSGAVILTLKDAPILKRKDGREEENEDEDVLENVTLVEEQKRKRNAELKKKKPRYDAYGEAQDILDKYDEKPADVQGIRLGKRMF